MPKTGNPFSPAPAFDHRWPVALPNLLADLVNRTGQGQDVEALTPEVMAPEEPMPPATPVNASMPEFLASLRTLLDAQPNGDELIKDFPAEAAQDFAHGTNELLNYLLHEVIGSAEGSADYQALYTAEAAQDFAAGTNELLNYLLSQEPSLPDHTEYSPEALADFAAGTQDLLGQLLAMANEQEPDEPEQPSAAFVDAKLELLGGLVASFDPPVQEASTSVDPETEVAPVEEPPFDNELASGLLSGLFASLSGSTATGSTDTGTTEAPVVHELGEVPREYIDESDDESVERPAGAFEMLLDAIDSELPAPPQIRGVVQPVTTTSTGERFIAFDLGGNSYALPFNCVLETDRVPRWTHVPGVPAHVRGVLNLRGEIIPLVVLRALFGFGAATADGRMLVIRDSTAKTPLAMVVDRLVGLASLNSDEITRSSQPGVMRGLATSAGRKIGLLDPDRVVAAAYGDHPIPRRSTFTHQLEEQSYV